MEPNQTELDTHVGYGSNADNVPELHFEEKKTTYFKKTPLAFLLKKDWSPFVTCLQGRYREHQYSRRRSRRLLHAFKSLYYEYCYVCDNLLPSHHQGSMSTIMLSNQNSNTQISLSRYDSFKNKVNSEMKSSLQCSDMNSTSVDTSFRNSFRRKLAPLMKHLLPDRNIKYFDKITRSNLPPIEVYIRNRTQRTKSHHIHLRRSSPLKDQEYLSMAQIPIALELLLPKIQMKVGKVMTSCPFLKDPLEVVADLRVFNYNVNLCIKHFLATKYIRDVIDEFLPVEQPDSMGMEKQWLKFPMKLFNSPPKQSNGSVDSSESAEETLFTAKVAGDDEHPIQNCPNSGMSKQTATGDSIVKDHDKSIAVSNSRKTKVDPEPNIDDKKSGSSSSERVNAKEFLEKSADKHLLTIESEECANHANDVLCTTPTYGETTDTNDYSDESRLLPYLRKGNRQNAVVNVNDDSVYHTLRSLVNLKITQESLKNEMAYLMNYFNHELAHFSDNLNVAFDHLLQERLTDDQRAMMTYLSTCVEELQQKCRDEERKRRHVYNLMQEQLGNVRVCCRCRNIDENRSYLEVGPDRVVLLVSPREEFRFDKVFSASHSQKRVYEDCKPLVISFIDGYNVCFITYGGEASGKTYTLLGGEKSVEEGLIQRSLATVLSEKINRQNDWEFSLTAALIEIYNDVYNDFLGGRQNVHLYIDQGLDDVYDCLKHVPIDSEADVKALVEVSRRRRKVAATALNPASSRSHLIALIRLEGKSKVHGEHYRSFLAMCDLAGFEDIVKAETQSDAKLSLEAGYINRSLTAFNRVFVALRKQDPLKVPYRDTKLTYFLKPFLINSGKCCLIVTVRSDKRSLGCTQNTLRFGRETRSVTLGKAKRQVDLDKYM